MLRRGWAIELTTLQPTLGFRLAATEIGEHITAKLQLHKQGGPKGTVQSALCAVEQRLKRDVGRRTAWCAWSSAASESLQIQACQCGGRCEEPPAWRKAGLRG